VGKAAGIPLVAPPGVDPPLAHLQLNRSANLEDGKQGSGEGMQDERGKERRGGEGGHADSVHVTRQDGVVCVPQQHHIWAV
jgi:hypothetical protein